MLLVGLCVRGNEEEGFDYQTGKSILMVFPEVLSL